MHRTTTVVSGQRQLWKQSFSKVATPRVHPDESHSTELIPQNLTTQNLPCSTVTENASMTGRIKVLKPDEIASKNYFSTSIGSRPCSLEERTKYFNGLGFDVVIFDSKGLYWRIPYDPSNITGTFEIACRITAASGVTVHSKSSPERIEAIISERLIDRAINDGWRETGGINNLKMCDWESVVYTGEFGQEDTLYMSELNLFITKITNYLDAPYHPDAIAKIEGRSYGKGITFGAFVNWNEGERPHNYYVRICERTRTLPVVRNHQLPTGVYRFIRDGDRMVVPVPVKEDELGITKFWHEIPIFRTAIEADSATSQNIIGQMEMDTLERERAALSKLHDEYGDVQTKLIQEKEALEQKMKMQSLETAKEKKELDLKLAEIKESSAIRSESREDTSSWLKYVASAVTIGVGLWKALS